MIGSVITISSLDFKEIFPTRNDDRFTSFRFSNLNLPIDCEAFEFKVLFLGLSSGLL